MRRLRLPALAVVCALAGYALWPRASESDRSAERAPGLDPGLVQNRVWVDSKPAKYTDYTHALLVLSYAPVGLFQKASAYQATTELFEYKRSDRKLDLTFPQSGKHRSFTYTVRRCDDLPPFDLCLDLDKNPWGGPRRYYGMEDPGEEARVLPGLRHHLEHHLLGAP